MQLYFQRKFSTEQLLLDKSKQLVFYVSYFSGNKIVQNKFNYRRATGLFISSRQLQPFILLIRLPDFLTGQVAVFHSLKCNVFISREILQLHIVRVILSAVVYNFQKMLFSCNLLFRGIIIISIEDLQSSILSTLLFIFLTLTFAVIQFCQGIVFISEHQMQ